MSFQNAYLNSVMDDLRARYAHEPEYLQAVEEFLEPLSPVIDSDPRYEQQNIVGRMAILAEGDAIGRKDITYLAPLPLFDSEGNPLA